MNRENQIRPRRSKAKQQQKAPSLLRTYSLALLCILMLVSGFFFAAQQHFSSMDYGMKNSKLRRLVDDLEAEKRRLLLAREVSLSPGEIKKAARKTGLIDPPSTTGTIAQVVSTTKEKALPQAVSGTKSMIIKTAAVSAIPPAATAAYAKKDKPKQQKAKSAAN